MVPVSLFGELQQQQEQTEASAQQTAPPPLIQQMVVVYQCTPVQVGFIPALPGSPQQNSWPNMMAAPEWLRPREGRLPAEALLRVRQAFV